MHTTRPCVSLLVTAALATLGTVFVTAQAREISMYVSVLDRDDKPVMDLRPDEFVIRENGVRREVLRASRATGPLEIALIVDNSAASGSFTQDLRESVRGFVRTLAGKNTIALVSAAERPTVVQDYTRDAAALDKGVSKFFSVPDSGAYVLQAIIEISAGIQKRGAERPVIVVVSTDGVEYSERYHDLVLAPLKKSGASLHVLFVQQGGEVATDAARERGMVFDRGTRDTGGRYDTVLAPQALTSKLAQVAAELSNQYIVTYSRPAALIQPDTFEVAVTRQGLTARGILAKTQGATR